MIHVDQAPKFHNKVNVNLVATPVNFFRVFLGELALLQFFFFFRFSVTIFSFLDFSCYFILFHFCFFFLLESNVMNTISDPVLICLVERNILVSVYFDVLVQGISGFLNKFKNNVYLYFLIQHKIIDPNN